MMVASGKIDDGFNFAWNWWNQWHEETTEEETKEGQQ